MKINTVLVKIIFLCFFLFFNVYAYSQEEEVEEEEVTEEEFEKQVINLSQLAVLMRSDEGETVISDYEIVSSGDDMEFLVDKVFYSLYEISPNATKAKKLYFYNCKFILENNSPLVFKDWEITKLNIIGCEFVSPIAFEGIHNYENYTFLIENCIFHNEIKFTNKEHELKGLVFQRNEFKANLLVDVSLEQLEIDNCKFVIDSLKFSKRDDEKVYYQFTIGTNPIDNLDFRSNIFDNKGLDDVLSLNLGSTSIAKLIMISNHMQVLNLTNAEVEKSLLIDELVVEDYIGILNFDFPEANTNIPWYNLGGEKFAIFNSGKPYQAKTDEQLENNLMYNDLMSAYNKFNTLYQDRGDIISANASYVEIKDIETRKQAFIQKVNPSLNNLINYKLNVFLRFFSDYATNPGKSLIQSIWVVLFFTFLYMLTFSRWDGMDYRYYLNQFNRFSEYIIDEKKIEDVFIKKEDPLAKEVLTLKKKYIDAGKDMPRILKLFGGPLHFLGKFRYDIMPGLISLFNFQPDRWVDIKGSRKVWAGFLIFIISFIFLSYVVVVKSFTSLIMSLNSFVVIGFGALPEEDNSFAMYFSIIEGIIGWFLLTIFTITLLSQVLQSF